MENKLIKNLGAKGIYLLRQWKFRKTMGRFYVTAQTSSTCQSGHSTFIQYGIQSLLLAVESATGNTVNKSCVKGAVQISKEPNPKKNQGECLKYDGN